MYVLSCLCLVSHRAGPLGPTTRDMSGEKPGFNGVEAEVYEQDLSTAVVLGIVLNTLTVTRELGSMYIMCIYIYIYTSMCQWGMLRLIVIGILDWISSTH